MRELFKKVRERAHTRDWKSAYTQQTLKCSSQVLRCEEELSHTSSEQQSHSEGLLCKKMIGLLQVGDTLIPKKSQRSTQSRN